MNYTDTQLKQALAKMLPKLVFIKYFKCSCELCKQNSPAGSYELKYIDCEIAVRDTELLHLCWLVEETLTEADFVMFRRELYLCCIQQNNALTRNESATWQQRTIALCKVKGVEIV